MNNLYEALEICLQDIEQGADVETVLFRYPDLADELRPILEASIGARGMAAPQPSADVVRRNRARVLQHAAQMREGKTRSSRFWFASLRRVVVTLAVIAALFVSGTGLVRAASTTLPGDNLYPVKRTWEDVLLLFTFNMQQRAALQVQHENERLHELTELFATGRSAEVDFAGTVTSQAAGEWIVNGIRVVISPQTEMRDGPAAVGSAVRVKGVTQGKGIVLAERIRLLSDDDHVAEVEYESEGEEHREEQPNDNEESAPRKEDSSGPGSGEETPQVDETKIPEPGAEPREESFDGVVDSIENNILIVDGIAIDISAAEVKGTPGVGVPVKVEGYYDASGVFIVTKIEFKNDGASDDQNADDSSGGSNNSNDGSTETNDNSNGDDHSGGGDNSNGDDHSNENGNDSGGGDDNSGSGGGGED